MLQLQSQSAFTALTVSDIKSHLNVGGSTFDTYIGTLLAAAVNYCERLMQMDCRSTTWKLTLERFPCWEIALPRGPVRSITSIVYYDNANSSSTLDSSTYRLLSPSYLPARIEPVPYWPGAYYRGDSVQVTFTTGFYDSSTQPILPDAIKHSVKLLCGQWFNMREDISYGPETVGGQTGEAVNSLLSSYTAWGYA